MANHPIMSFSIITLASSFPATIGLSLLIHERALHNCPIKTNLVVHDKVLSEMHKNSVFGDTEESKSILNRLKGNLSSRNIL